MARFSTTVRVSAPQAAVFEVFSDLDRAAERISGIVHLEKLTDGPMAKGTRFRETRVVFKRQVTEEMEVTDFEAPRRYVVGAEMCGCTYSTTFHFVPNGTVTDVEVEVVARPVSFMAKLTAPIASMMFPKMMAKCFAKDLGDLKKAVEGERRATQADPTRAAAAGG